MVSIWLLSVSFKMESRPPMGQCPRSEEDKSPVASATSENALNEEMVSSQSTIKGG